MANKDTAILVMEVACVIYFYSIPLLALGLSRRVEFTRAKRYSAVSKRSRNQNVKIVYRRHPNHIPATRNVHLPANRHSTSSVSRNLHLAQLLLHIQH